MKMTTGVHSWARLLHLAPCRHAGRVLVLSVSLACDPSTAQPADPGVLALDLAAEGSYVAAAIEYRRLAIGETDPGRRAGYYWAAAYAYNHADDRGLTEKMLDRCEEDSPGMITPSLLLRAESRLEALDLDAATFHLESVLRSASAPEVRRFASLRLAHVHLLGGDLSAARSVTAAVSTNGAPALTALDRYESGHDRKPWLGGLLGMIPGCGYWYSGEYANGARSLILNALFIYGMADTSHGDEWGAFTAITFFELTWYTGSIYGGIDAAHRFNRTRLDGCISAVDGDARFEPDLRAIPLVTLRYTF